MKKVLFIASVGGHLQELIQLDELIKSYDSYIVTDKVETSFFLKEEYPNVYFLKFGDRGKRLKFLFIFAFNILKSLYLFLKIKPDFVLSTGTHTSIPMCFIAHLFHKKVIYIETFANSKTPSKAGKYIYKYIDLFVVQWPNMEKIYPNSVYWGGIFK